MQLASAASTGTYGTRAWTYDQNGNRATEVKNGVTDNYYLAANSNRLSNVAQGSTSKRIFTYDAAGNVIQDFGNNTNAYNYTVNSEERLGAAKRNDPVDRFER